MRVAFVTLGCRTNEAESRYMALETAKMGYDVTLNLEFADIYVLNTCSITQTADAKSRQLISRVLKLNNKAKIFVCGCSSENNINNFNQPNVKGVYGTGNKYDILKRLKSLLNNNDIQKNSKVDLPVRRLVKIQDGCNQFCTYCIVPYLRKNISSRTISEIVSEVENASEPEINFTGINLYLFNEGLTNLLTALNKTEKRIRLGSLDPRIIDEKFLKAAKKIKNFCPQFHLSIQSMSDKVLNNMNRHHTAKEVLNKIKLIKKYFKTAFVACDIIVGFPGETDEDFNITLKNLKLANFSYMHVFPYSPRKGTVAEKQKQVNSNVKTERAKILGEMNIANFEKYRKHFVNKTEEVLIEEIKNSVSVGHSKNYIKCYINEDLEVGKVYKIKFLELFSDGMTAKTLDK